MKKSWLAVASLASVMMFGCGNDPIVQDYSDAKSTGTVSFLLRDNVTGELLSDVNVILVSTKLDTMTTTETGYIQYTKQTVGNRLFRIEKEGYAGKFVEVSLSDGNSDAPRVMDVTQEVYLPKIGASVSGRVYYQDKNGNQVALEDATVDLYLKNQGAGSWIKGHASTTTSAAGIYSFDSLPEDVALDIFVRSLTIDGKVYAATATRNIGNLKTGEARTLDRINMAVDGDGLALLSDNFDGIGATDSVVLTFSTAIDTAEIIRGDIAVSYTDVLATTYAWSAGNHTLTIYASTGSWFMEEQSISLNLVDVNGSSFTTPLSFTPTNIGRLPANASNLRSKANVYGKDTTVVNSITILVTLTWTAAARASGYTVYKKTNKDSAYIAVVALNSSTDTSYTLNTTGTFDSSAVVKYMVLAFNDKGDADVATAPAVTLSDKIRPKVNSNPGEFGVMSAMTNASLDNSASAPDDTLLTDSVTYSFTENMDTTIAPALTYSNNAGSTIVSTDLLLVWRWTSQTEGRVVIGVLPKKVGGPIDGYVDIDLSDLTDEIGNLLSQPQSDWNRILVDNIP